jgi:hypothetical protein
MEIPIEWVLTMIGVLAATISTLAVVIYRSLEKRIEAQNLVIRSQATSIAHLQEDVKRLAAGCNADGCHWTKGRGPVISPVPPISPTC